MPWQRRRGQRRRGKYAVVKISELTICHGTFRDPQDADPVA